MAATKSLSKGGDQDYTRDQRASPTFEWHALEEKWDVAKCHNPLPMTGGELASLPAVSVLRTGAVTAF